MFGARLKELREKMGISQRELANNIQLSPSTIAMYELEQRSPDKDTIIKLACFLNCSTDYLLGKTDVTHQAIVNESVSFYYKLPVLGTIHTGLSLFDKANIEGYLEVPGFMEADFVFRFTGDSMIAAGILDGDFVICRQMESLNTGDIVLVLDDLAPTASLKCFYRDRDEKKKCGFKEENLDYSEILISERGRIVGVMVGLLRLHTPAVKSFIKNYDLTERKDWEEVFEKASRYGLTPEQLKRIIDVQGQIIKEIINPSKSPLTET